MSNDESLRAFAYLTAERSILYRVIMRSFLEEREQFAVHLRSREIADLVAHKRPDLADEAGLSGALDQLCEWGNLERHLDTSEVRTVEEFYRPRYLYQLSRAGEEAEKAVARFLEAVLEGGELQAAALGDIRSLLGELGSLMRSTPIDEAKVFGVFTQLRSRFEELTSRAQIFMSSLQRSLDRHTDGLEGDLLRYKEVLISYLQKFVLELRISAGDISGCIREIEQGDLGAVFACLARRELSDALGAKEEDHARVANEWSIRWRGLRSWFLGDQRRPPLSETLRRKALSAIPQLLGSIHRLNERRIMRTDRGADLRVLARWFAETDADASAHRLWMATFGLTPSRHLLIDAKSLVEREASPVRPQTSWTEAPTVQIAPRFRQTSRFTRRGPGTVVVDRSKEKEYLAAMAKDEAAQLELARSELLEKGEVRLSALGPLSDPGFALFLDLLGDALARQALKGQAVEALSSDGSLLVRLEPLEDGSRAHVSTPSGTFSGPDYRIRILSTEASLQAPDTAAAAMEARV
jgi:uncharacterized protein (TIGR02677 family)